MRVALSARGVTTAGLPFARYALRGSGDADVAFRVAPRVRPLVAGRAVVHSGAIAGANPFRAVLTRAGAADAPNAPPALKALDLAFDELRLQFRAHGNRWSVPAVTLAAPDFSGTANLYGTARTLAGTGSLRVAAGAADALLARTPSLSRQLESDGSLTLPFAVGDTVGAPRFTPRF